MDIEHGHSKFGGSLRVTWIDYGILAFMLACRGLLIAFVFPDQAKMFNGDSPLYEGLAINLLEHGAYEFPPAGPYSDVVRPPGYPLMIFLNYALFGKHFLLPILWNLVGVVFIFLGIKRLLLLLGERRHSFVLAFFALDLAWLLYSKELVTEPLFTPVLLWCVVFLIYWSRSGHMRWIVPSALLLGVGALIKPLVLYLPVVLVPYVLLARRQWRPVFVYIAVFSVCVGPWLVRNLVVHDTFSFTYVQNDNLLFAHGAFVYADAHNLTHVASKEALSSELQRRFSGEDVPYRVFNAAKGELAREILAEHPLLYAKAIARGMAVTLFDPGRLVVNRTFPSEDPHAIGLTNIVGKEGIAGVLKALLQKNVTMVVTLGLYLAFLGMVFCFAVLGVRPCLRADPNVFVLITLILGYLLIVGGPNGYARFRLYIFPFLLVYTHFGIVALKTIFVSRLAEVQDL